jgi:hypothetical protein
MSVVQPLFCLPDLSAIGVSNPTIVLLTDPHGKILSRQQSAVKFHHDPTIVLFTSDIYHLQSSPDHPRLLPDLRTLSHQQRNVIPNPGTRNDNERIAFQKSLFNMYRLV